MSTSYQLIIRLMVLALSLSFMFMGSTSRAEERDDEGWVKCADEGEACRFSGTREVRYGAEGKYAVREIHNGVECSNAVFGDPIESIRKHCDTAREGRSAWLLCAKEGETCRFRGVRTVRYGADEKYVVKEFTNSVECNNSVFGDPIEGTVKHCEIAPALKTTWTPCAKEGETCRFTGTRNVRYGGKGRYSEPRTATNGIECGNGVFGDPAPSVFKQCEYSAAISASWTKCAREGESCRFTGMRPVRYGANGKFAKAQIFKSEVACNNATFGDPIEGITKECEYGPEIQVTWTKCANEGGICKFRGMRSVRYGARGKFATQEFASSVECSNQVFGDPIPGYSKQCEYGPEVPITWTKCAREGEVCGFVGVRQVRYGADGKFVIKDIDTTTGCNNQVFGDPTPGESKYCEYGSRIR